MSKKKAELTLFAREVASFFAYQYLDESHSIKQIDGMSYAQLHDLLLRLQKEINKNQATAISKHELDRLIWYVYR